MKIAASHATVSRELLSWMMLCLSVNACGAPALPPAARVGDPSMVDAHALLEATLDVHGRTSPAGPPLTLTYHGKKLDAGHYAKPRELREYALSQTLTFHTSGRVVARGELERDGEVYPGQLESTADSLYWVDYGESDPTPARADARVWTRLRLYELFPSRLLSTVLAAHYPLQYRGTRALRGRAAHAVSFVDETGSPRTLYVDVETKQLVQLESTLPDPLFGDDLQTTEYLELQRVEGFLIPTHVVRRRLWFTEDDLRFSGTAQAQPDLERVRAPVEQPTAAEVSAIGPGLYQIQLPHLNNRTLFAELDDYVVAFEAPLSSDVGELILDRIARTTSKPVRMLFVSHHHPDYVGGIRPFVARDVTIVTTPGNLSYVEQIASAQQRLRPDAQTRAMRPAHVQTVEGHASFGAGANMFEVYDIGPYTGHTDEYLVYYFKQQRILFEGDLVSLHEGAELKPAGRRAEGLLRAITALGLDVDRVYESWPLRGCVPFVPVATLKSMVALRQEHHHE